MLGWLKQNLIFFGVEEKGKSECELVDGLEEISCIDIYHGDGVASREQWNK